MSAEAAETVDEAPWDAAVRRGLAFLHRTLDPDGLPSARPAADPAVRTPLSGAEARRKLLVARGVDLGFDPDGEGFSAMWGLVLLAPDSGHPEERELVDALARQVGRFRDRDRYRCFPPGARFPADTDTTAVALAGLARHGLAEPDHLAAGVRELLAADTRDTIDPLPIPVYWDEDATPPHGLRYDAVACANILSALQLPDARGELPHPAVGPTIRYVHEHANGPHSGTRYYPSPEAFLHSAARATVGRPGLHGPVRQAFVETAARPPTTALDLALLTLAAEYLAVEPFWDNGVGSGTDAAEQAERRRRLVAAQRPDGSWPAAAYFRTGRLPLYFGSAQLSTLFALRALRPEQPAPR
ncbi:hypothetical protein [Kitasatospora sp. NPDC093806]|uniref:hypothetical protein n=1 Tax=Kitasatospora sp. NPDC093806 TaxID=3155075 RepID=UPI0034448AEC